MPGQEKIQIKFEATGNQQLVKALEDLRKAHQKLHASSKNLSRSNESLRRTTAEADNASRKFAGGQKLVNQRVQRNVKAFGKLQSTISVYRNKLLLAAFAADMFRRTIGNLLDAYAKQEQAERLLTASLGYHSKALEEFASAQQQITIFGDEVTLSAMSQISAFIKGEKQIKMVTKASMDLATLFGWDLNTASQLLTKTISSSTNALQRYGIEVEGAVGSAERFESVIDAVNAKAGGLSEAMAGTYAYEVAQLGNAWGDLQEELGKELAPILTKIVKGLKALVDFLNPSKIKRFTASLLLTALALKTMTFAAKTSYGRLRMVARGMRTVQRAARFMGRALKGIVSFLVIDFLMKVATQTRDIKTEFESASESVDTWKSKFEADLPYLDTSEITSMLARLESELESTKWQQAVAVPFNKMAEEMKAQNVGANAVAEWLQDAFEVTGLLGSFSSGDAAFERWRADLEDIFEIDAEGIIVDFTDRFNLAIQDYFGKPFDELNMEEIEEIFARGTYLFKDFNDVWQDFQFRDPLWVERDEFDDIRFNVEGSTAAITALEEKINILRSSLGIPLISQKQLIGLEDFHDILKKLQDDFEKLADVDVNMFWDLSLYDTDRGLEGRSQTNYEEWVAEQLRQNLSTIPETFKERIERVGEIDLDAFPQVSFDIHALTKEFRKAGKDISDEQLKKIIKEALKIDELRLDIQIDKDLKTVNDIIESFLPPKDQLILEFNETKELIDDLINNLVSSKTGVKPIEWWGQMLQDSGYADDFDAVIQDGETYLDYLERMHDHSDAGRFKVEALSKVWKDMFGIDILGILKGITTEFSRQSTELEKNEKTVANLTEEYNNKTTALAEIDPVMIEYNKALLNVTDAGTGEVALLKEAITNYQKKKQEVDNANTALIEYENIISSTLDKEQDRWYVLEAQKKLLEESDDYLKSQKYNADDAALAVEALDAAMLQYAEDLAGPLLDADYDAQEQLYDTLQLLQHMYLAFDKGSDTAKKLAKAIAEVEDQIVNFGDALDAWGQMGLDTVTAVADSMASELVRGIETGKMSLNSFYDTFQAMFNKIIAEIIAKQAILALVNAITGGTGTFAEAAQASLGGSAGGQVQGYSTGGIVPSPALQTYQSGGTVDNVPALLTEGEFVMRRDAVDSIGLENLNRMNMTGEAGGGNVVINFKGNVLSKSFIEKEAIPLIRNAVRRGAKI